MRRILRLPLVTLLLLGLLLSSPLMQRPVEAIPGADEIAQQFFTETNGGAGPDKGYAVRGAMYAEYQSLGGRDVFGPPVSREFIAADGKHVQYFQTAGIELVLDATGQVTGLSYVNVIDRMHDLGKDGWLQSARQVPPIADWSGDTGKPWDEIVARHLAILDDYPDIKTRYFAVPGDQLQMNGLPMAVADMGNVIAVRCQRSVYYQWKVDVPWASAGQVTVGLVGDFAKDTGLIPPEAVALEDINNLTGPVRVGATNGEATPTPTPDATLQVNYNFPPPPKYSKLKPVRMGTIYEQGDIQKRNETIAHLDSLLIYQTYFMLPSVIKDIFNHSPEADFLLNSGSNYGYAEGRLVKHSVGSSGRLTVTLNVDKNNPSKTKTVSVNTGGEIHLFFLEERNFNIIPGFSVMPNHEISNQALDYYVGTGAPLMLFWSSDGGPGSNSPANALAIVVR
ncbi:MAG: hypothetical protein EPO21_01580 [Chloroflexota bacterium]|nr:MAG: hypothetical protein EPO21_01580 [Chloroflexota bacterium]